MWSSIQTTWQQAESIAMNGCRCNSYSTNASADCVGVRFHWKGTIFTVRGRWQRKALQQIADLLLHQRHKWRYDCYWKNSISDFWDGLASQTRKRYRGETRPSWGWRGWQARLVFSGWSGESMSTYPSSTVPYYSSLHDSVCGTHIGRWSCLRLSLSLFLWSLQHAWLK